MELNVFVPNYGYYLVKVTATEIKCISTKMIGTKWEYTSWIKLFIHNPKDEDVELLTTNNLAHNLARYIFPKLQGAKRIKQETIPNFDENPYGKIVKRGDIDYQKWDLSAIFSNK